MFKNITIFLTAFILGFAIGDSDESDIKKNFEEFIVKMKKNGEDIKNILFNLLNNIEGIETDEIKMNLEKLVDLVREKINELIEIDMVNEKIKNINVSSLTKNIKGTKNEK